MALFGVLINFLKLSALLVIVGSTITIGALAAPVIFKGLAREEAARVMIEIFARYDVWLKFAAISLLISSILKFILIDKLSLNPVSIISLAIVLIITIISFYEIYALSPQILDAYKNSADNFQHLHSLSEKIHKMNFLLGLALLFLA